MGVNVRKTPLGWNPTDQINPAGDCEFQVRAEVFQIHYFFDISVHHIAILEKLD